MKQYLHFCTRTKKKSRKRTAISRTMIYIFTQLCTYLHTSSLGQEVTELKAAAACCFQSSRVERGLAPYDPMTHHTQTYRLDQSPDCPESPVYQVQRDSQLSSDQLSENHYTRGTYYMYICMLNLSDSINLTVGSLTSRGLGQARPGQGENLSQLHTMYLHVFTCTQRCMSYQPNAPGHLL